MFALNRLMELFVHLCKDIINGDTVGVTLLDINVPRKTRVEEPYEGTGRLEDELGKVYVVMISVEIAKFNVFECEGMIS